MGMQDIWANGLSAGQYKLQVVPVAQLSKSSVPDTSPDRLAIQGMNVRQMELVEILRVVADDMALDEGRQAGDLGIDPRLCPF